MKYLIIIALFASISISVDAKKPDVKSEFAGTTISGYVQTQFRTINEADATSKSTFTVNHGHLQIESDLTKSLSTTIEIDATTESVDAKDMYLKYKLSPWFSLKAGQMKKPFSFAQLESPRKAIIIDDPTYIQDDFEDYLGRDVGIITEFEFQKKLGFAFGVFNGAGSGTKALVDNNNSKDFAGRVEFTPIKYLTLAANASSHGLTSKKGDISKRVNAYGADIYLHSGGFRLITEGLFGDKPDIDIEGKMLGFYITTAYKQKIKNQMISALKFGEIGARVEFADNDRNSDNNAVTSITPYIGIYFDPNTCLKICPIMRFPQQGDKIVEFAVQAQTEF